jgi:hypothetical protein
MDLKDPIKPAPGKIIRLDRAEQIEKRETAKTVAAIRSELDRPQTPAPYAALELLEKAALGNTGQSRSCRYLLFLLPGAEDPTGFKGEGLLEMRTLDRALADAFLEVINWWRGPTESDELLYAVLQRIEKAFPPKKGAGQ